MQEQDLAIGPVKNFLQEDSTPTTDDPRNFAPEARFVWAEKHRLKVINNVLVRSGEDTNQLVVPESLRARLFNQAHAGPLAAHLAAERTQAQLQTNYY